MSKTFSVQVCGGLFSRVRVMIGGLAYARATGRKLYVSWPRREDSEIHAANKFDCKLSDLYKGDFEEVGWDDKAGWPGAKKEEVLGKSAAPSIKFRNDKLDPFMPYIGQHDYLAAYQSLKPTPELTKEICKVRFPNRPVIGVQVRHAIKSKESAGVGWYLDRLDHIEMTHGDHWSLFLACDDPYVARVFIEHYGYTRLLMLDRDFAYDRMGIMRQCADAHLLRSCHWVIGANHSSYGQHVALIRGAQYLCDSSQPNHVAGGGYEDLTVKPDVGALASSLIVERDQWQG